jgi:integrase
MASLKLILNKERAYKDGKYPLVFQIIQQRKRKVVYTQICILANQYDESNEKVRYVKGAGLTKRDVNELNEKLSKKRAELQNFLKELARDKPQFTADDFSQRFHQRYKSRYLFVYLKMQIEMKEKLGKYGTANAYRSTMYSLMHFTQNEKLLLSEIDADFLYEYEQFLLGNGNSINTVAYYFRNFHALYNRAEEAKLEVSQINPFLKYRIKTEKTVKRALSKENMRKIAQVDLSDNRKTDLARDVFMFSFFTRGMAIVDIIHLKKEQLNNTLLEYRRKKTNQHLIVQMTEAIQYFVDKYRNSQSEYVFPFLDPEKKQTIYRQYRQALGEINIHLKEVARRVGLGIDLTTYVARHSWASIAKETGAPISQISDGLGHTSEKTTLIYLKELDLSVLSKLNEEVSRL